MPQINLDSRFRRDSAARRVAERLLTGRPASREELVADDGVSVTTVNRVVEILEEEGARIIREVNERQAVFQVVEVREPRKRLAFPELDAEGVIVKDELVGGDHVVEFSSDDKRFRGVFEAGAGAMRLPPVGTTVLVDGVLRGERDSAVVVLRSPNGRKIRLTGAQNITR